MGLLVERDGVKGLANAMQYLIKHPEKIKEFGENAHEFAKVKLNWDKIVRKIYEEIGKRNL